MSVVATAGRVWVTSGFDVVKLDAATGRIMRRTTTRYPFPLEIGISDGSVWVSSVEDGFVAGALTRIPFERGRVVQPLVLPSRPILSLAVGSGTTWALVGPWASLELAAVDQTTGRATIRRLGTRIGWIAADDSGGTPGLFGVTMTGQAVRLDGNGRIRWHAQTDAIRARAAVGLGSVWAAGSGNLYRIDALTGDVQAAIPLRDPPSELAIGGGYVWVVTSRDTATGNSSELLEIDPRTARIAARRRLDSPVGPISFGSGALWMGRSGTTVGLVRINPKTLAQRLFATNLG